MTRYRDQRGGLAASLATQQEFATRAELVAHLRRSLLWPADHPPADLAARIKIKRYANDPRIGWHDTHLVTIEGYGVAGFTDGPLNGDPVA